MTDEGTITVVLADDHPVVRSGLRMLLEAQDDVEVVAKRATSRPPVARSWAMGAHGRAAAIPVEPGHASPP
jgi:DNA-binding NarL/FixJ family response regulator